MKNKNFTKKDIIKNLSKKTGFSTLYSDKLINDLLTVLTKMISNNSLTLKNIGSFKIKKKESRVGRNPKTKKEYMIQRRNVISFKASTKLLHLLNQYK